MRVSERMEVKPSVVKEWNSSRKRWKVLHVSSGRLARFAAAARNDGVYYVVDIECRAVGKARFGSSAAGDACARADALSAAPDNHHRPNWPYWDWREPRGSQDV